MVDGQVGTRRPDALELIRFHTIVPPRHSLGWRGQGACKITTQPPGERIERRPYRRLDEVRRVLGELDSGRKDNVVIPRRRRVTVLIVEKPQRTSSASAELGALTQRLKGVGGQRRRVGGSGRAPYDLAVKVGEALVDRKGVRHAPVQVLDANDRTGCFPTRPLVR